MRLINTLTLRVREFIGDKIPLYVILSHTWGEGEVLLADIEGNTASLKKGYEKIVGCCRKAANDGFEWAWIDTCCIDKTSSAELSEAINSMYAWYARSAICYAYLQDISSGTNKAKNNHSVKQNSSWRRADKIARKFKPLDEARPPLVFEIEDFWQSRWFGRGWTLQELLAPKVVEFYTSEWTEIGTKESLAHQIYQATLIPVPILRGSALSTCSVAERMSWASKRQTTRLEDRAYSLLGIFNVNMPLLYGEGKKSFIRLQEQILKQEEDYSIFTWTLQEDCEKSLSGVLASSPSEFSKTVPYSLQLPTMSDAIFESNPVNFESRFGEVDTEDAEFYLGDSYTVIHTKHYERLILHDDMEVNEGITRWEPPELTSRGLRVTLSIRRPKSQTLPAIAWTGSVIDNKLVCIMLEPGVTSRMQVVGRYLSSWLLGVKTSFLTDFVPTELFLHPYGIIDEYDLRSDHELSSNGSSWGRLRIITSQTDGHFVYVISSYPAERWNLDEIFFPNDCKIIASLALECVIGEQKTSFLLCCGLSNGRAWCAMRETEASFPDGDWSMYQVHESADILELNLSDRCAFKSDVLDGRVLAASIRRRPVSKDVPLAYVLQINAYEDYKSCDSWVRLLLPK